jgi:hypothetical protein
MALTYKTRKRLSLLVLVVGMPAYVVAAVTLVGWIWPDPLNKPSVWLELLVYVVLGLLWAMPFRKLFRGVGQPDPDAPDNQL